MKILVANLGSTSLKWRLFDFSNGQERLLHKGGFERVTHYPQAIEDCLAELKTAGAIARVSASVRKSIWAMARTQPLSRGSRWAAFAAI